MRYKSLHEDCFITSHDPFKQMNMFSFNVCIVGLNILFRRKGLGVAYNATMPSPEEVFTKEPNHTHTHTSKNRMFDNIKRNNN